MPVAAYVVDMRDHLEEMMEPVRKNAENAQQRQKAGYDGAGQ